MRQVVSTLAAIASASLSLVAATACKSPPSVIVAAPAAPAIVAPAASAIPTELGGVAQRLQDEVTQLELTKDVTCWNTSRLLDNFISSKEYSAFATATRLVASKALVRAAWQRASAAAKGPTVTAADIVAAAPAQPAALDDDKRKKLAAFATDQGLKAFKDYRTTSEHWRVLLAVAFDELRLQGESPLKPPADAMAYEALADITTRLGLLLLQRSGALAFEERTPLIEASAVKRAHAEIAEQLQLRNAPRHAEELPPGALQAKLAPLTKALITGKIKALHQFNRNSQDLVADLNRLAKIPVTADAVEVWLRDLQSFAHFLAAGYDPMQADNFLSDGQYDETALQRKAWVDFAGAENAAIQLFPHVMMPNGDMRLRFEPAPGLPNAQTRTGYDAAVLDHEQNGVRDTAIHWIALDNVWQERAYVMEPFAAEFVSELLSMMATWYLRHGEALAIAQGLGQIDASVAAQVRDRNYVMVMPKVREETVAWPPERWQDKAQALAQLRPAGGPLFGDVTAQAGLPTALPSGATGTNFDIHKVMGAGMAVGDVDGDGFSDLFIAGEGLGRLYLNRGQAAPGQFTDATAAWGIAQPLQDARGVLFLDQDGDGDLDLLVLRSEHPSLLLRQTDHHFADVASEVGLATWHGAHVATAFDADRDGDLDLYIGYYGSDAANRTQTARRNLPALDGKNGTPHQLFRLERDGKYKDVAAQAGVASPTWTLALGTFDYDDDGDMDLMLANDFGADVLYRNRGDGTFDDVSARTRTDDRGSGMNVSFADVNRDGKLDLYVTNIDMFSKNIKVIYPRDNSTIHNLDETLARSFQYLSGNKLYLNPGDAGGETPFAAAEITRFEPGDRGWGWAAQFFDFDLDGDQDMYLANGWIAGSFAADQKNQLFVSQNGYFYLAPDGPEAFAGNSRSVVVLDADGDGDLDIVANQFRQPPRLLRNIQAAQHQWLRLRLVGLPPNTRAVGARVTVSLPRTTAGAQVPQVREVTCGSLYLSQDDEVLTFGLADRSDPQVQVRWPDGRVQDVAKVSANRTVTVVERK